MAASHRVVSNDQWLEARKKLPVKEKEFTRMRDELSRQRRDLPWEAVTKECIFDGPNGRERLPELFDGRSQLVVYRFISGPIGAPDARTARAGPTISTASSCT